jgi:hypothetical protein
VGSTLGGMPGARVIHENAADQLRGHSKKMGAILPLHAALIDQLHPRFMHECGALQGVSRTFAAQVAIGQPPQLGIHERRELFQRALVTLTPINEQTRHIRLCVGHGDS